MKLCNLAQAFSRPWYFISLYSSRRQCEDDAQNDFFVPCIHFYFIILQFPVERTVGFTAIFKAFHGLTVKNEK